MVAHPVRHQSDHVSAPRQTRTSPWRSAASGSGSSRPSTRT